MKNGIKIKDKKPNHHKKSKCITVHDWASYHESEVFDDGTESFFWRAHTLTVLFLFTCFLLYVAIKEAHHEEGRIYFYEYYNKERNIKRGILASIGAFLLFGVIQTPDGPFKRPHPVVWRFIFCISILYELFLIFLFFQTPTEARNLLKHIDANLGVPLPEKSYGGNCKIYDPIEYPNDPFFNLKDKMDEFVPTHFFGWWFKTLILRDWWLCTVLSVMFEILEYTLEHQLPNFSECWWDHWILDVIVCNGAGIYLGMKTIDYLSMKPYYWSGLWNIPGYKGKLKRVAAQFSPYSWIRFDWQPTATLNRWLATLGLIFIFLLAELNTFYLKYVLWLKPAHYFNLIRLIFFLLAGGVSMRETFQYMDDPRCKKFGRQAWIVGAIIVTELLIIYKFDPDLVTKPFPPKIVAGWTLAILGLLGYTFMKFFIVTPPIFRTILQSPIFAMTLPPTDKSRALAGSLEQSNFSMNESSEGVVDNNGNTNDGIVSVPGRLIPTTFTHNVLKCARKGLELCDKILGPSENIILNRNYHKRFSSEDNPSYHHFKEFRSSTLVSDRKQIMSLPLKTPNILTNLDPQSPNNSFNNLKEPLETHSAPLSKSPEMEQQKSPDGVFNQLLESYTKNYFYLDEYTSVDSSGNSNPTTSSESDTDDGNIDSTKNIEHQNQS